MKKMSKKNNVNDDLKAVCEFIQLAEKIKKRKGNTITLRLSNEQHDKLIRIANARRMTKSECLREYIKNEK